MTSDSWNCDGIPKNGREYPGLGGVHDPHTNYSLDCEICGLPKESSTTAKTSSTAVPLKAILPVALVACLGIGGYIFRCKIFPDLCSDNCAEGQVLPDGQCTSATSVVSDSSVVPAFNPAWISLGENRLFRGKSNARKDDGVKAFKNQDLVTAKQQFQKAITDDRNDPEAQIYLNNAEAALEGSPLKIAAIVPVEKREASAKEMLRGVADAQTQFNAKGGVGGKLVQIVIANDANDAGIAQSIAQELASNQEILGIIGHNSSGVSKAALKFYEQADLVMISPTSTDSALKSDYFFRTVPNDVVNGERLAEYAQKSGVSKVAVFYDSKSNYSQSLQTAFASNFSQFGGDVVETIDMKSPNFSSENEIENLKDQNVDAIALFPSTKTTSVAIGVARANTKTPGTKLKMLGGDSLYSSDTLDQGGTDVNGLVLAIPWFFQNQPYAQKANERWIGTINWRTASSFDATQALLKSLQNNPDRKSVKQNLESISILANDTETSGNPISFANGERKGIQPVLVQIDSGSYSQSKEFENGFRLIKELF